MEATEIKHVAVVGAGTMGAGIAQVAAQNGCRVTLIDISADVLRRGMDGIERRLARSVEKVRITADQQTEIMGRLTPSERIADLNACDLAIEAVVEDVDAKHKVFQAFDEATPAKAVLATNTSSLRITDIASAVRDPARVVGMHFFNPAPLMPLVEIIAGDRSGDRALTVATRAANLWGKIPVRAKDTPGFIVNRVARGYYLEALRMLGEGIADVETIDTAMRTLGGFRMGPFQLMDLVGLDVNYAVSGSVYEQMGRPPRLTPHDIQRDLVERGHIGRKAATGFYRYDTDPPTVAVQCDVMPLDLPDEVSQAVTGFAAAATQENGSTVQQYVFSRILATIMNEASSALADNVASAADIDTAMQKGTNYPRGPLTWSNDIGPGVVARLLRVLENQSRNGRYIPCGLFKL